MTFHYLQTTPPASKSPLRFYKIRKPELLRSRSYSFVCSLRDNPLNCSLKLESFAASSYTRSCYTERPRQNRCVKKIAIIYFLFQQLSQRVAGSRTGNSRWTSIGSRSKGRSLGSVTGATKTSILAFHCSVVLHGSFAWSTLKCCSKVFKAFRLW